VSASPPLRTLAPLRRVPVLACLGLACVAHVLAADPRQSYTKGIAAAGRGDWKTVVSSMRAAAAENGKEAESVTLEDGRSVPYLPHYYLGLGLALTERCDEALAQWQESERQQEVQKTVSLYQSLLRGRDACKRVLALGKPAGLSRPDAAGLAQAVRDAESAVQNARAAAAQVSRRYLDSEYAEAWKAELAQATETAATQAIAMARDRLEHAKSQGPLLDVQEATRLAVKARQDLESLAARLDQRRAEIRQAHDKEAADKAEADRQARLTESKLTGDRASAEKLAREQVDARREAEARDLAQRQALTATRQSAPPPEVRRAVRAFLRADYPGVVHALATVTFAERRANVTAALLLAAARYYLYLEGGEKDADLRRQAGASAHACRRLAPNLSPDPRYFSPRFRQFFRTMG
jgi:hypothetical protein